MENYLISIQKAQNGDKDEMAKLVEENQGLIWNIAKRFFGRGYDKEDIYQIGCMGFIKSIRRFDISFDARLSTYAVPYILGEIKKFLRDDGPVKVSRSLKELNIKINELQKEFEAEGKEISITEIAEILKISKEEIIMAIDSARQIESIEDEIIGNDKGEQKLIIEDTLSKKLNKQLDILNFQTFMI